MDVLRAMRVFRMVVKTGSIAAAARFFELTPGSVSEQLSLLELHLGTQLLQRSQQRLALTDAGRNYLDRCEQILNEIDAEVADLEATPRGRVRLALPTAFGLLRVAPQLGAFAQQYPEIELQVSFDDRKVDLLDEDVDLGVRIGARLDDSSLKVRRLTTGRRILCAAPNYLRAHGMPRQPQDLALHACLIDTLEAAPSRWGFTGPEGMVQVPVQGPLRLSNGLALREAALSGAGIALLPDYIVQEALTAHRLRPLLERYAAPEYGVFVVSREPRITTAKVQALVDFLSDRLKPAARVTVLPRRGSLASRVHRL